MTNSIVSSMGIKPNRLNLCTHCEKLTFSPSLILFGIGENTRTDECFDFNYCIHKSLYINADLTIINQDLSNLKLSQSI